ncbi:MAG: ABC transporter permease [Bacteroidales bacterium]|nr:ABC transporter permease [Bacteroidales bacterium]
MNYEFFIAKRLVLKQRRSGGFSRSILGIAVAGIAVGLAVMLVSVAIVTGFKNEISRKVIGFGAHISITNYDSNSSYETVPISGEQTWLSSLREMDGVKSVDRYIVKAGIVKTADYLQGVVFKGVDEEYNWSFFEEYLVDGKLLEINDTARTNGVLVSQSIANVLNLKVGDSFAAYFIQNPPRMRKFTVEGIYNTQLEEFDKMYIVADIKHLRKLNDWKDGQVSGFEVKIDDIDQLDEMERKVSKTCCSYNPDGEILKVTNIRQEYPGIFDWLSLLDMNVWIILGLMVAVTGFNMISGLLVLILERVNMIGILKSMGATNVSVRKVFLYFASYLTIKGLLWGNVIGILLCVLQYYFGIIHLDPASYYVSTVPINLDIVNILLLNAGTLVVIVVMMILPSFIVSKITPADSMRFE